jgi:hypothetical protein
MAIRGIRWILGTVLCTVLYAQAASPVEVEITMAKITSLLKQEKYADALPYFARLESSGVALPESFYFYQIQALYKSNDVDGTLAKGDAYFNNFDKSSKYHADIIAMYSEFDLIADKRKQAKAVQALASAAAEEKYSAQMERYKLDYAEYLNTVKTRGGWVEKCRIEEDANLNSCIDKAKKRASGLFGTNWTQFENSRMACSKYNNSSECENKWETVPEPVRPRK